jgi:hypothetical protein
MAGEAVGRPGCRAGGERGIRTLGRALRPYGGLANRWFEPLTHLSVASVGTAKLRTNYRAARGQRARCANIPGARAFYQWLVVSGQWLGGSRWLVPKCGFPEISVHLKDRARIPAERAGVHRTRHVHLPLPPGEGRTAPSTIPFHDWGEGQSRCSHIAHSDLIPTLVSGELY